MKYENIVKAAFVARPNRFIARAVVDGTEVTAHVKNTGRCRELLVPGATVYLEDFTGRMGTRKLAYSLIGVEKETSQGTLAVNMDSQAPNKVVKEALEDGTILLEGMGPLTVVRGEKVYGESRFDFYVEDESGRKGFIEVKGVTLENAGVARFPDAPTERGVKHIRELMKAQAEGYRAWVIFVVQMKPISVLEPNDDTHRAFGDALRAAKGAGVNIRAFQCDVTPESLKIAEEIPVDLHEELF